MAEHQKKERHPVVQFVETIQAAADLPPREGWLAYKAARGELPHLDSLPEDIAKVVRDFDARHAQWRERAHKEEHLVEWAERVGEPLVQAPPMREGETHLHYLRRTGCHHPDSYVGEHSHEFLRRTRRVHVQANPGETKDEFDARIAAIKLVHWHEPHFPGQLKALRCSSEKHDERRNLNDEHDYRDVVAVFDGSAHGPHHCNRCAHYEKLDVEKQERLRIEARAAVIAKLGLNEAEFHLLFPHTSDAELKILFPKKE